MFCPECGCKLESGAKFCSECGFKIDIAPVVTEVAKLPSNQEVAISTPTINTPTTEVVITDGIQEKRQQRNIHIQQTGAYSLSNGIAKYLDGYHLDPIIGFVPVLGDVSPFVFSLPSIYLALVHIKSMPLALSMIFNVLVDVVLGMIPFYIGNIADFFVKAYKRNMKLVEGYLNDDKEVIKEVNAKAVIIAILIVIFCLIIYWLISVLQSLTEWIGGWFS